MSDNDLDNVVQIGEKTEPEQQELNLENKVAEGAQQVVDLIDKNLEKGLKGLEKKLDNLDNRELLDPAIENTVRDLTGALKSAFIMLEAMNSLQGMIRHDMVGIIQNLEQQAKGQWMSNVHLQTLLQLMQDKGMITEEELRATWDKIVELNKAPAPQGPPQEVSEQDES